ncbi:MAG TPA: NAD-dependent epimerase/dehydratase family protein [Pseudonocardiaceae bacterium]
MRLLVLGGTVFVSKAVATAALRRGHTVVCAARGTSGAVPEGAELVRVDRTEGTAALAPLSGEHFDAVVDVATMDPPWVRDALEVVGPTARHWTFVSSMSVYADHGTPGQDAATAGVLPEVHERPAEVTPDAYGGAKVASENLVSSLFGGPAFLVRPGLIVGGGDVSDRHGYWPARFARAGGPVLVPEPVDDDVQFVDVRDLADWILLAAEERLAGTFDAVCGPTPRSEVLARTAAAVGAPDPDLVSASPEFLAEHTVSPWSGPRSLPLWAPGPEYAGFMRHDVSASLAAGLRIRPFEESATDALVTERELGLDRTRHAGLSAAEEAELLSLL